MKEEHTLAFEHAWKYFELHSQQRMTVFNFYIAVIGLLGTGSGICLQLGGTFIYFTSALGIFITFITFIFYKLDDRISFLIKNSELALIKLEGNINIYEIKIFTIENNNIQLNNGFFSMWTYGKCFRVSFYVLAYIGMVISLIPLIIFIFK
ncbi:hypothetical protein LJN55_11625 [Erwinia rhapontici]|uniref:hypothetical protein n=1 Tax=Erwinia rhapontici TaxID=55212 RepID=UPI001D0D8533|nr:hypothetical protein [Erwinia rhapontici]UDQ82429.1 hypothetical protein LJN55_11625 [Erwinia rhapontici]